MSVSSVTIDLLLWFGQQFTFKVILMHNEQIQLIAPHCPLAVCSVCALKKALILTL